MSKNKLQLQQLESKIKFYAPISKVAVPPTGWIKAVRLGLGMTLQQLAKRISVSKQSVHEMEQREKDGSISLKLLRDSARALDMVLVYGFVPKDGTLDALIEREARELAVEIINRTSNTMKLEDQENTENRIKDAIEERTSLLKNNMPKILWD